MKESLLDAWGLGVIQDALNIYTHLKANGEGMEYIRTFLEDRRKSRARDPMAFMLKECPECGKLMKLRPLEENDCQWVCTKGCSVGCGYSEYVGNSFEEEKKKWLSET